MELNSQDFKEVGSNRVAEIQDDQDKDDREPKRFEGKVALCKNCQNISIDIARCTECNEILSEGKFCFHEKRLFVYIL